MNLHDLAAETRSGRVTASERIGRTLDAIRRHDPAINATTRILAERAQQDAAHIDAAANAPGPLAGIPFGVKDLFDLAGLPTTAGAAMLADAPPASQDAKAVRRLCAAGAIPVATLNMDEFAYGFATVNAHHGTTRNPHDRERLAGGSSGGSAAAVAAGLLPFTLGSDTNGSIRVPASLCGVYGLKPTHGALPMEGVHPFVDSFDDIGPFARSIADLKLVQEILAGQSLPDAERGRVARLGGYFLRDADPAVREAMAGFDRAMGGLPEVEAPQVDEARSAAFLMTAMEGGARHLDALRRDPLAFDPATRDRLIAGALFPASAYFEATRFRDHFRAWMAALFKRFDILIAPATPCPAPLIADPMMTVGGQRVPARAHLGMLTQPLSFIGLPVIAAPLLRPGALPIGIQLIAAPGEEARLFALAAQLEAAGLTGFTPPSLETIA